MITLDSKAKDDLRKLRKQTRDNRTAEAEAECKAERDLDAI